MSRFLMSVVAMVAAVLFASQAQALLVTNDGSQVFFDTFENGTPGNLPDTPDTSEVGTWTPGGTGAAWTITNAGIPGAYSGSQYLQGNLSAGFPPARFDFASAASSGTVKSAFMYYLPTGASDFAPLTFRLFVNGVQNDRIFGLSHLSGLALYDEENGASNGAVLFVKDEWNKVEVEYTIGAATAAVTITNSLGAQTGNINAKAVNVGAPITGGVFFTFSSTNNGAIYIDDIPEPASLALVGLGGALMLRRKR